MAPSILAVLARRPHPEQGFRTCLGVLRLFRGIEAARAETVSSRAIEIEVLTYASVASILKHRLDRSALPQAADGTPLLHDNTRGPGYFDHQGAEILLTHPLLDRLYELGLDGMAKGFRDLAANPESRALEHAEWLGLLVDQEATLRQQKRFEARTRTAKLRQSATVEDVDFRTPRGLDRTLFLRLASCDWVREHRHCLITGPCGTGKTFIACALGDKACRDNLSVLYQRSSRLFGALALARGDGRYARLMRQLARVNLLILDDWGPEPLNAEQRRDLLEIVEDRYNCGSMVITSQVPVERWYEIVGNPTLADAILDRVVHNAHRIELKGETRRKRPAAA